MSTGEFIDLSIPPCRQARAAVARHPDRLALVDGERRFSFAAAWSQAEALARGLLAAGLAPGDRVALWMANRAEMLFASWAAEIAALVRVPLNARATAHEVAQILADCRPALLLTDAAHAPAPAGAARTIVVEDDAWQALIASTSAVAAPLYHAGADELCSINYTSGSTGGPKGVMLSHRNWMAVYRNMLIDRDIRADDRLVHIGPLSHASGAYVLAWFLAGAASVISPPALGADGLLATIERERCTVLSCVPTLLTRLLAHPRIDEHDLASLRQIACGGEPMPATTLRAALERFGPIIVQNYGQTEAMMTCAFLKPDEHFTRDLELRQGALGRPYTHVEIMLRAPDGQPVPAGAIGEITVHAEHVMQGYWERPEETARVLRDGWLWTGDLARLDEDGILRLAGRSKDMLICGGFNIYPQDVETVLSDAPGVREAAVIGLDDPAWGEIPVAFVAGEALSADALAAWAKPRLGLRTPKRWVLLDELPRTAIGKVDKQRLRSTLTAGKRTPENHG